jgi:hypothetical protein
VDQKGSRVANVAITAKLPSCQVAKLPSGGR